MPNIKQQKKRVGLAARQRLENLRYRSTVKTLTRNLQSAVAEGNGDRVRETHLELQRWIDRAASRHRPLSPGWRPRPSVANGAKRTAAAS